MGKTEIMKLGDCQNSNGRPPRVQDQEWGKRRGTWKQVLSNSNVNNTNFVIFTLPSTFSSALR